MLLLSCLCWCQIDLLGLDLNVCDSRCASVCSLRGKAGGDWWGKLLVTLLALSHKPGKGESGSVFFFLSLLSARLVLLNVLGCGGGRWRGSDRRGQGLNLMPVLINAFILSVNPKRVEAREREEWKGGGIRGRSTCSHWGCDVLSL